MSFNYPKIEVKPELTELIKNLCVKNPEIKLLSLSTIDGFNIKAFAMKSLNVESDKLAAMASSLFALSNSSSEQLMQDKSTISTIESDKGNFLLMKSQYLDNACVIAMVAKSEMSLAEARFHLRKVSEVVSALK